jgi:CheY-like chemotaxis protein
MVRDPSTRRGQILLVEDDDDSREVLAEVLEEEGYDVVTAADGRSAVDLALASSFDVAIIDIGLPSIDGYEVARRIRSAPKGSQRSKIRLVALTGHAASSRPGGGTGAGAGADFDLYLTKPIDPQQLLRALAATITAGPRDERSESNEESVSLEPPIR